MDTNSPNISIIPIIFTGFNKYGDFNWMINQQEYNDVLFIFNDNEEYHNTNKMGKGNAIIRVYNSHNKKISMPRSAGIPTGTLKYRGYKKLNKTTKQIIDNSIDKIKQVIQTYNYKKICFSADANGKLGTALFKVNPAVIDYITEQINHLSYS
jgi:hypothetical protein